MDEFRTYYALGLDHILDINGYDHILFVIALCALYRVSDWKKVLILVTAFTIGHSITLALATVHTIRIPSDLIEFMIPLTILITSISNLFTVETTNYGPKKIQINYLYAVFFGMIHGIGFSNYLRSLLGEDATIFLPLFAFNVGIEMGQIFIVLIFMAGSIIFTSIIGIAQRDWKLVISSIVVGITFSMLIDSVYW